MAIEDATSWSFDQRSVWARSNLRNLSTGYETGALAVETEGSRYIFACSDVEDILRRVSKYNIGKK